MAGNPKQKLKLMYISKILMSETDENHPLDANEICELLLKNYDIKAERKSIYDDINVLTDFGLDIIKTRTPKSGYFIASRDFDLPEVSLLVDAVESANFITPKKTKMLVGKLEGLLSRYEADDIHKKVFIENRNKCANEEIFYNIDILHSAVNNRKKVRLIYIRRVMGDNNRIAESAKEMVVNPYALVWENDHYYLIGNLDKYNNLIHLRLDRMKRVTELRTTVRHFSEVSPYKTFFDVADYTRKSFNMFGGELKTIELRCREDQLEQVVDRFGDKLYLRQNGDGTFTFSTKANISEGLISWLLQFGGDIEALSPPELRKSIAERIAKIQNIYGKN